MKARAFVLALALVTTLALVPAAHAASPKLKLAPPFGPPTTKVKAKGSHYPPGDGAFTTSISVPASALPGPHTVSAFDVTGLGGSAPFVVQTNWGAPLRPGRDGVQPVRERAPAGERPVAVGGRHAHMGRLAALATDLHGRNPHRGVGRRHGARRRLIAGNDGRPGRARPEDRLDQLGPRRSRTGQHASRRERRRLLHHGTGAGAPGALVAVRAADGGELKRADDLNPQPFPPGPPSCADGMVFVGNFGGGIAVFALPG